MFNVKQFGIASTLTLALCGTANAASVTYDYVGNDFNKFSVFNPATQNFNETTTLPSHIGPRITGSATFADGIENPVTSFMLTDGKNTLDSPTGRKGTFFMTFINDNVDIWNVGLISTVGAQSEFDGSLESNVLITILFTGNAVIPNLIFSTTSDIVQHDQRTNGRNVFSDQGSIQSPGTWTLREDQISPVPVPAALPLMASALGLFGFIKRRNQSV